MRWNGRKPIANGNWDSLTVESLRNHGKSTSELSDQGNYLPTSPLLFEIVPVGRKK